MTHLTLQAFQESNMALFANWLQQEHVAPWYTEPEDWLYEAAHHKNEFSWIKHFIVLADGVPIGFCQYYDCYAANDFEEWYSIEEPHRIFSIDYLIGETAYLGQGYGKRIVQLLTDWIRQKEQAVCIIVQPEAENHASNHVLLANGYHFDSIKHYYCKWFNE